MTVSTSLPYSSRLRSACSAPLEARRTHVPRLPAPALRVGRDLRPHVGRRVAHRMPIGRRNRRGRLRQLMPQHFQLASQKRIIEHEPHIVFDHAQPLASPIQRGVEDANCRCFGHGSVRVTGVIIFPPPLNEPIKPRPLVADGVQPTKTPPPFHQRDAVSATTGRGFICRRRRQTGMAAWPAPRRSL